MFRVPPWEYSIGGYMIHAVRMRGPDLTLRRRFYEDRR